MGSGCPEQTFVVSPESRRHSLLGVRRDRRELTSPALGRRSELKRSERRSPAFYATRRDVGWLVALLTLLDSAVKVLFVLVSRAT